MNTLNIPPADNLDKLNELREDAVRSLYGALNSRKITRLDTDAGTVAIFHGRTNAAPYEHLQWIRDEDIDGRVTIEYEIGDGEDMHYVYGDFRHGWYNPTVDHVIHLLESWDDIKEAFQLHDQRVAEAANIELSPIE